MPEKSCRAGLPVTLSDVCGFPGSGDLAGPAWVTARGNKAGAVVSGTVPLDLAASLSPLVAAFSRNGSSMGSTFPLAAAVRKATLSACLRVSRKRVQAGGTDHPARSLDERQMLGKQADSYLHPEQCWGAQLLSIRSPKICTIMDVRQI